MNMMTSETSVLGKGIFTSYDGLRAEGKGNLSFFNSSEKVVELRIPSVLDKLPSLEHQVPSLFLQRINTNANSVWCFGAVSKITDYNKRLGILGACISMKDPFIFEKNHIDQVLGIYNEFVDHYLTKLVGRPLPKYLGFSDANLRSTPNLNIIAPEKTTVIGNDKEEKLSKPFFLASAKLIFSDPDIDRIVFVDADKVKALTDVEIKTIDAKYKKYLEKRKVENRSKKIVFKDTSLPSNQKKKAYDNIQSRIIDVKNSLGISSQENTFEELNLKDRLLHLKGRVELIEAHVFSKKKSRKPQTATFSKQDFLKFLSQSKKLSLLSMLLIAGLVFLLAMATAFYLLFTPEKPIQIEIVTQPSAPSTVTRPVSRPILTPEFQFRALENKELRTLSDDLQDKSQPTE